MTAGKDCRRSVRRAALPTRPRNLACTQLACFHCTLDRVIFNPYSRRMLASVPPKIIFCVLTGTSQALNNARYCSSTRGIPSRPLSDPNTNLTKALGSLCRCFCFPFSLAGPPENVLKFSQAGTHFGQSGTAEVEKYIGIPTCDLGRPFVFWIATVGADHC